MIGISYLAYKKLWVLHDALVHLNYIGVAYETPKLVDFLILAVYFAYYRAEI